MSITEIWINKLGHIQAIKHDRVVKMNELYQQMAKFHFKQER
jgi:hypothetical protein